MITTTPGNTAPDPTNAAHYTNDYWSFTTTGGNVTLNVLSGRSILTPGVADPGKTLDAKLTIYNTSGVEVATTTYGASLDATITQNLAAGTYYAKVTPTLGPSGTGEVDTTFGLSRQFFDIGSYFITGTIPGLNSEFVRYWDNASGNGFGNAGGTWQASTTDQWNTDSIGNGVRGSSISIATLDAVHFGTDTVGLAAGTVTVDGNVSANRITFGAASGAITLSGGTITLASVAPTVTVNNATSTIASVLAGNAGIIKAGNGTLVLSGANTHYGATTINGGILQLTGNGTLSDVSAVNTAASGTSFDISGITAASEVIGSIAGVAGSTIILGAKDLTVQGATATAVTTTYAGVISGSGGSLTKIGADTLVLTGNNTYTGGTNIAGGTLSFNNVGLINTGGNITFTGAGRLQWNGHTQDLSSRIVMTDGVTATIDTNNQNVTFASAIGRSSSASTSTGGLTKAGGGVLTLSAASTFSGVTTANGGVLLLNHASALPGGTGVTGGTSALTFTGGVLGLGVGDFTRSLGSAGTTTAVNFTNGGGWAAYNADRTVNLSGDGREIVWATANTGFNGQTLILGATSATHKVTFVNGLNLGTAARTVQADDGAASIDAELSGVITGGTNGALTKSGSGTLAVTNTNTYIGATTISAGILQVSAIANGGVNSNIGASSNAAANLVLNGGTLRYTGVAVSTDRGFTLSNNSSIDASGTGAIRFTNTATPAYGTANATRTLTLTGTNTGNNTLAAGLANNGTGAVSVTKSGIGTWALSGTNSYTGATTVSAGTLQVNGTHTSAGAYAVNSGGTLGGTGSITTAGNAGVTVAAGGKLAPGASIGTLTMNLGTGSLNISAAVTASNSQSLVFEIGGTPTSTSDKVVLSGTTVLNIGTGVLEFNDFAFLDIQNIATGTYTLFDSSTTITGSLGSTLSGSFFNGIFGSIAFANSNQDIVLNVTAAPEPTSLTLLGLGGMGMLDRRRRSLKRAAV